MSNWVRDEREPQDVQTLVRIASALRTSVDWLVNVPGATAPDDVQAAVEERVRRARDELRDELLAAIARWSGEDGGK